MSTVAQAIAVTILTNSLTLSTYMLENLGLKGLLDLNSNTGNVTGLTKYPTAYYIRGYWKDIQRVINVFDADGNQVYSFERLSAFNPVWSLLTFPERRELATINTRFFARAINFHSIPNLVHRKISSEYGLNGNFQNFYLNDGAKYSWTRGSKFLEKIINPNGSIEEQKTRIAKVKLMRQFKFDFEMLVDEDQINPEIALSTGFMSILTQWGFGENTDTVGPTFIDPKPETTIDPNEQKITLIIDNNDKDTEYEFEAV